jgi:hypothetical protein
MAQASSRSAAYYGAKCIRRRNEIIKIKQDLLLLRGLTAGRCDLAITIPVMWEKGMRDLERFATAI